MTKQTHINHSMYDAIYTLLEFYTNDQLRVCSNERFQLRTNAVSQKSQHVCRLDIVYASAHRASGTNTI
jgi:hypothetical protein